MHNYIERRRACEARQVTPETQAEVAAWCGGMAMPDGTVLFKVGDVWLTALDQSYIVNEGDRLTTVSASDFQRQWEPNEYDRYEEMQNSDVESDWSPVQE